MNFKLYCSYLLCSTASLVVSRAAASCLTLLELTAGLRLLCNTSYTLSVSVRLIQRDCSLSQCCKSKAAGRPLKARLMANVLCYPFSILYFKLSKLAFCTFSGFGLRLQKNLTLTNHRSFKKEVVPIGFLIAGARAFPISENLIQ